MDSGRQGPFESRWPDTEDRVQLELALAESAAAAHSSARDESNEILLEPDPTGVDGARRQSSESSETTSTRRAPAAPSMSAAGALGAPRRPPSAGRDVPKMAMRPGRALCEECGLKQPNFGLLAEGRRRWCSGCAKPHAAAVDLTNRRCEDCQTKVATCGLLVDGKKDKRWCSGCVKAHPEGSDWRKMCADASQYRSRLDLHCP
jgi:hypothetical protein